MSRQQQQSPYHAGNYPPPLFAAELDSSAPSSRFASAQGPDGAPVFEMPGEPVPSNQQGEQKRPSRTQSPAQSGQANPWPFYLDGQVPSNPAQEDDKDKPYKDPSAAPQPVMANPWAYFGPEAAEDTPAPLAIASGRRPSEEDRRPSGPVPHGTRPPASTSPSPSDGDTSYYPAPLKLGGRPAKTTPPTAFKPYSPPPTHDVHDVQDAQVRPLAGIGRTDSQSTTTSMPYRPYRPHSPQTETTAAPAANIPPTTIAPAPPVTSTPTPPVTASTVAPAPLQNGIAGAAPAQGTPSMASPYLPSPMSPSAQSISVAAPSPATPSLNAGVPFAQPQYAAAVPTPNYAPGPTPGPAPGHAPGPSLTHPPVSAAVLNAGVPFTQPTYASPIPTHNYGSGPSPTPPVTSPIGPPQSHTGPPMVAPTPAHGPAQPMPGYPNYNYNVPQPSYAPAHTPPTATPAPGAPSQPPQQHAPYQQPAQTGPGPQQPPLQHSTTEPYMAQGNIPQSPPPPYAQTIPPRPGSQPPTAGHPSQYQQPPPGPGPAGPYPPQPQYPTQPTYTHGVPPPIQGQPSFGLQPPPLPPRPASAQGGMPTHGFGSGPAGYNPANFPAPPQTYFSPPPALPPRPGAGGVGKIFGSSSADKWLRKTGQVLESTLAPILQGQSGQYRPGQQQGQPVPQGQQGPRPYASHMPHFHAPHLAPQFRGAPDSDSPTPGPGAPGSH
ncbi:uncharacterized protein NECHADRAFT_91818 [Fusarium vanettenii 77-13-4]|uniref:Uncharacterized protein n=1 Tax=Fusarium vanettenii (strain ATCC MYA-4622 / CBS 123669 / FGSC 9596 / NRRL 45880 / 77-13-4) TaxID=660122 RepID=C7YLX2_FUSV7|nr:uncharacterized protein NECHADRAFT_91818 [Fusarium vanettenii 77-13-4]EEU47349.1 hypothetical protein NECHADRAFT_91818 [Fusarium vanettenii 77-13-4]